MININILNDTIEKIVKQIPLVNSYYNDSPYESWNTQEIKYGSISFIITGVNTSDTTTTYDTTLYYADRLLEDKSNRDNIHSDAAFVIQTVVGALNQADDLINVEYPVNITLFEQDFADTLAGGYANISIETAGMGECFDNEFDIPEIVGTSLYFDKEEIIELFPMKTDLAAVAYTGSFSDLKDVPDFTTNDKFDNLTEAVLQSTSSLAAEIDKKVNISYFDGWADGIENELKDKTSKQDYNNFVENVKTENVQLKNEVNTKINEVKSEIDDLNETVSSNIDGKLDADTFNEWKGAVETEIDKKATTQQLETLKNNITGQLDTVKNGLNNKVSSSYFEGWKETITSGLNSKTSKQDYNNFVKSINETTKNLADDINKRLTIAAFENWKQENDIDDVVDKTQFNLLYERVESVNTNLTNAINTKLNTNTFDAYRDQINTTLNDKASKQELNNLTQSVIDSTAVLSYEINKKLDSNYFELWKDKIDDKIDNIAVGDIDLSDYYTKNETYSKTEINKKIEDIAVGDIDLSDYYTKTEIDNKLENIDVDLSDYYTKTEIDNKFSAIDQILHNVLYEY